MITQIDATDDYSDWLPQMITTDWLPQMITTDWLPQMIATDWLPQMITTDWLPLRLLQMDSYNWISTGQGISKQEQEQDIHTQNKEFSNQEY